MVLANEYEIWLISFRRKGEGAYNCLSIHKNQKPCSWHIELLEQLVERYKAEESAVSEEDGYSDMY